MILASPGSIHLPNVVHSEILDNLAPGAFHYGKICVIEFDPDSLWHEISLATAGQALRAGVKVEYHVFQHSPVEIRSVLTKSGLDLERFEKDGSFRIIDSYTVTTPLSTSKDGKKEPMFSGKAPDASVWTRTIQAKMKTGFEEKERHWLHIDDNEAVLLQFSKEESVLNGWRTTFVPMAKSRELLVLHGLVSGIASESFYRKTESMADAVLDIKTKEEEGTLQSYVRIRAMRGAKFYSGWRRVELTEDGEIQVGPSLQMESVIKRRLAAIMFTDMVGYTTLGQKDETLSITLMEEQRKLIRPILRAYDGREIKTMGDAFLVEFRSALAAAKCAYDIQKAIKELRPYSLYKLRLRIGIHVGDVVESQDGDISGDAVNVASRIESLAEPGGICISRQVYDHIHNKLGLTITNLGAKSLKNVTTPLELFRVEMFDEKSLQ